MAAGHNRPVADHTEVVRRTGPEEEAAGHMQYFAVAAGRKERFVRAVDHRELPEEVVVRREHLGRAVVPAGQMEEVGTARRGEHLPGAHSGRNRAAGTVAVPEPGRGPAQVAGTGMELLVEGIRRQVGQPREGVRRTPEGAADRSRAVGNSWRFELSGTLGRRIGEISGKRNKVKWREMRSQTIRTGQTMKGTQIYVAFLSGAKTRGLPRRIAVLNFHFPHHTTFQNTDHGLDLSVLVRLIASSGGGGGCAFLAYFVASTAQVSRACVSRRRVQTGAAQANFVFLSPPSWKWL